MPVPQIPTSISNMVDLVTYLNEFYASLATGDAVPAVGAWEVLYTRKVAAGTASDGGYIDTGIVYDGDYEYASLNLPVAAPTPDPTSAASMSVIYLAATYGTYKPNGVDALAVPAGVLSFQVAPRQDPSALLADFESGIACQVKMDATGKFYTKWTQDMAKDGHWCLARRRRYG